MNRWLLLSVMIAVMVSVIVIKVSSPSPKPDRAWMQLEEMAK